MNPVSSSFELDIIYIICQLAPSQYFAANNVSREQAAQLMEWMRSFKIIHVSYRLQGEYACISFFWGYFRIK